ncbi:MULTISPECIES: hypothetical protein [Vibrio]|uniref:hypothetical protein n=1 Tax=Vibrio TaxID=662 RepID=UPI0015DDBBAC|nr:MULTISPECIES: hypothetical protein [Vibrio]MDG2676319.1 hypothetical protein [Vibrio parahaemolyticus]MDW1542450.1 hypothetical protein [Vibrio sp. YT-17]HBH7899501.1 hypothetical protein [Vibrio parahaemolyticus]
MSFEIKIPGRDKSYDRAVKKDGEWIGLFSGEKLSDIQKKHPKAEVVPKSMKKSRSR